MCWQRHMLGWSYSTLLPKDIWEDNWSFRFSSCFWSQKSHQECSPMCSTVPCIIHSVLNSQEKLVSNIHQTCVHFLWQPLLCVIIRETEYHSMVHGEITVYDLFYEQSNRSVLRGVNNTCDLYVGPYCCYLLSKTAPTFRVTGSRRHNTSLQPLPRALTLNRCNTQAKTRHAAKMSNFHIQSQTNSRFKLQSM